MEAKLASMEATWRPSWPHMEAKLAFMDPKLAAMEATLEVDLHGGHMEATMGAKSASMETTWKPSWPPWKPS
jgi:hypothetical protein